MLIFVGTYTEHASPAGGKSEGIYVFRMNPADGALTPLSVTPAGPNPSFLALHPTGRYLYAVNEVDGFGGQPGGGVSAFALDARTGALTALNQQLAHGAIPCHISVDATGRFALAANFVGGNVVVLPIAADGSLLPAVDNKDHRAIGPAAARAKSSHAHSITLDPGQRRALAADLGLDAVFVYQFDNATGQLSLNDPPWAIAAPGAGPRHLEFHPNGRFVYLINELNATLSAYAYDSQSGGLTELQTLSTLPPGYAGGKSCADVHVSPSGAFLYGSNRGHDSIVIHAIDQATGLLTYVGHQSTLGETPRNFGIDPSGTFLYALNQDSDQIAAFRIDPRTGALTPTGQMTPVPAPVCIKFQAQPAPGMG